MEDVLAKIYSVFENVVNKRAKKQDVRPGAERSPNVRHGGGAAETRIDVDDLCAALARFDYPLKTNGMILCHVRAHDQNGIRVHEVAWRGSRPTAAKGRAQTGHGRAMSYTGLIADADHPEPGREELL